jgi:oxysterol-binding protein-related protein 9/10/11
MRKRPLSQVKLLSLIQGLVHLSHITGGNIIVKQVGHATLTVSLPDGTKEDYLITLPRLRIEGLWYGSPYIELTDTSHIQSSSGWLSTIKYQGKGYFSGKSHSFKADLTPPIGSGSSFHASSFEGQWNATSKDLKTGVVFTDVTGPKEEVTVRPAEEQGEWESRTLWCKVAKGIRESDFETAAKEKSRIEVFNFSHNIFPIANEKYDPFLILVRVANRMISVRDGATR